MSDSAKSSTRKTGAELAKAAGGYIKNSAWDYFSESMPTTSSTMSSAKRLAGDAASAISNAKSMLPKLRNLRRQSGIRSITNWFLNKESDYDDFGEPITFDIDDDTSTAEIADVQISEAEKSANKISRAVVEATHKNVEAQLQGIANLMEATDRQTSTIAAGFDRTNDLLGQILEVVTKNTSSILESNIAGSSASIAIAKENMIQSRKFNLETYKKIVADNIQNSEIGMFATILKTMKSSGGMKSILSPENLISLAFNGIVNKKAPNLKRNLRALDDVIGDTIMSGLLRLGEKSNSWSPMGILGKMFGINGARQKTDTGRSEIEVKGTPFDTITKEYITSAIPGYLRKILVALGGPDVVYDATSRSFRSQRAVTQDYKNISAQNGSIYRAPAKVRQKLGTSEFSEGLYDLLMTELGTMTDGGRHRTQLTNLSNPKEAERVVLKILDRYQLSRGQLSEAKHFARNLSQAFADPADLVAVGNLISSENVHRNRRTREYVAMANSYGLDLSSIDDSARTDQDTIMERLGVGLRERKQKQSGQLSEIGAENHTSSASSATGTNYTNLALYNIYRRLNEGLNAYIVGTGDIQQGPYDPMEALPVPQGITSSGSKAGQAQRQTAGRRSLGSFKRNPDEVNDLKNNTQQDGTQEDLSGGERFLRWGKNRGGALVKSIFSGSPEEVKKAFSGMMGDIVDVAKTKGKDKLAQFNRNSGNLTGKIKHRLFGTGYTRTDYDENGNLIEQEVADNKKGGMLGFVGDKAKNFAQNTKASADKWLNSVKGMFDFDKEDGASGDMRTKQRRIMSLSVGALGGLGLIGGPMGLLVGTIAGGALGMTGLGSKIKGLLFGRDKDGKAKGIFTRAGDAIVTPIKYQMGKTVHLLGQGLKKNLLGPLSNIGHAIKDRISSSAEKHFGKTFGAAGKLISGLITMPFKVMAAPFTIANKLLRGGSKAGGWAIGKGLNGIARIIGAGATHKNADGTEESYADFHKRRVNEWKEDYDNELKNSKYKNYKTYKKWTEEEQAKAAAKQERFNDYISEKLTEASVDREKAEETQSEIKGGVDQIVGEIIPGNSFKTHDTIAHSKLDTIITLLTSIAGVDVPTDALGDAATPRSTLRRSSTGSKMAGSKKESAEDQIAEKRDEDKEAANSAVVAAAVAGSNGGLDKDDTRAVDAVISEASSENPNKSKVFGKVSDVLGHNEEKVEAEEEKKSGLWEMLSGMLGGIGGVLGGIASNLPAILAAAGGLLLLFTNPDALGGVITGIGKVIGGIGKGIGSILGWMSGTNKKDAVTTGVNAVTGIADVQVNSVMDYVNPTASLYHNETDAAGNQIVNKTATLAKNEVTWLEPAKLSLVGGANKFYAKSDAYLDKAIGYESKANAAASAANELRSQGGVGNNIKALGKDAQSKYNSAKADKQMNKALDAEERGDQVASGAKGSLLKTAGRVGVISAASGLTGFAAGKAAEALGVDEETAAKVGNVTTSATAAGLTANMVKSGFTGKTSMVDKIINGLKSMLEFLAKKFKAVDALKGMAGKIDDIISKIMSKTVGKITDTIADKIVAVLAKYGIKATTNAATLGLGYVAGALDGLASGVCGVEHLFAVLPGEADAGMITISAIMGTAFGALEFDPVIGWAVAMIDVLDTILIGVLGCGLKQFLARSLYKLIGGEEAAAKLEKKQQEFSAEKDYYNETYGANLDDASFNDMVNSTNWWDKMWNGGMEYDEEGHLVFDDAGARKPGGLKGVFVGENDYVKDEEGNVVRNADGEAVVKKDKYGHTIKKEMKLGDHIGNFFSDVGSFFGGQTVYETDENGNALVDENGEYVVKDKGQNIFGRIGDFFMGRKNYKTNEDGSYATDSEGNKIVESRGKNIFQRIGTGITNFLGITNDTEEEDRAIAEETNPVVKAALQAKKGVGSILSTIFNPIGTAVKTVKSLIGDGEKDERLKGSDGDPIKMIHSDDSTTIGHNDVYLTSDNLPGYIEAGQAEINTMVTNPFANTVDAINAYNDKEASWRKAGYHDIGDYAKDQVRIGDNRLIEGYDKLSELEVGPQVIDAAQGAAAGAAAGVSDSLGGTFDAATSAFGGALSSLSSRMKKFGENAFGGEFDELDKSMNPLKKAAHVNLGYERYPSGLRGFSGHFHHGVDIVPNDGSGDSQVNSLYSGTIEQVVRNVPNTDHADPTGMYSGSNESGNMVAVRRPDGSIVRYMHMKAGSIPATLAAGQRISAGTRIGDVGSTGRSTGKHLHMDIRDANGRWVNPLNRSVRSTKSTRSIGGTGSFKPRLGKSGIPKATDKHWIRVDHGGLSPCFDVSGGSCLPNCVGYAWGRAYEILGTEPALPNVNASQWYTTPGMQHSSTPVLGAVMCWKGGKKGWGHVAIVEKIETIDNDIVITTSESAFEGARWQNVEYRKSKGYVHGKVIYREDGDPGSGMLGNEHTFQGFIIPTAADGSTTLDTSNASYDTYTKSGKSSAGNSGSTSSLDFTPGEDSPLVYGDKYDDGSETGIFQQIIDVVNNAGSRLLNQMTNGFIFGDSDSGDENESDDTEKNSRSKRGTTGSGNKYPKNIKSTRMTGSVTIPDEYGHYTINGKSEDRFKLGSMQGWEYEYLHEGDDEWRKYNHGWSKDSNQGMVRADAIKHGRYRAKDKYGLRNIATIDDRILIATNQRIGTGDNSLRVDSGDLVDVGIENADGSTTTWKAMIGDAKSADLSELDPNSEKYKTLSEKFRNEQINEWGHNNGVNVVEFIYDKRPNYSATGDDGNRYEQVRTIRKTGTYQPTDEDGVGGPTINAVDYAPPAPVTNTPNRKNLKTDQIQLDVVHKTEKAETDTKAVGGTTITSDAKTDKIIGLLAQMIVELKNITSNTGESSEKLGDISQKNFVDHDLRNELSSIKSSKSKSNSTRTIRSGNASTVFAMARP